MRAPLPWNESERLASLRRLGVLDTSPELAYDRVTRLACRVFSTPVALVSLVDEKRQWFKSACGLDVSQTDRDLAFCSHALHESVLLCVPNSLEDARFSDNPLVTGSPYIRFYAGAPLRDPHGLVLGTLCVIDYVARPRFTELETANLIDMAALVMDELELRRTAHSLMLANQKLAHMAATDSLTSLPNRLQFEHEIEQRLADASGENLAVLYMDLDRFKAVNDGMGGHAAGDLLLQEIANRLRAQLPEGALLARMGGDEFVALIRDMDVRRAERIAADLCAAINGPITMGDHCFRSGVSIGVALYPKDGETPLELIRQADRAMYESKRNGGSCYRLASGSRRETRRIEE